MPRSRTHAAPARRRPAPWALLALLLLATPALAGCPTGEGEGRVVGRFFVLGCDGAYNFGARSAPARYDMGANFYVGEPILDEAELQPRHRLDLRIQKGGNNIEDGDSLYLQIDDVAAVAERFALGEGSPVGPGRDLRASLLLYVTCPTFFGGLAGVGKPGVAPCPVLDATALEERCAGLDFNAPLDPDVDFPPFVAGQSCVVFCRFGGAERGRPVSSDFHVGFGDVVQGFFQFDLAEPRLLEAGVEICADGEDNDGDGAVDESDCEHSSGYGTLRGTFNFEVRRGQVAQEFP